MKEVEKKEGKGWLLKLAGRLWTRWVKTPIIGSMDRETMRSWKHLYEANHPPLGDSQQDQEKFVKWFFNRAEIKRKVKDFIKDMFVPESEEYSNAIDAFAYEIDKLIEKAVPESASPTSSPGKQRYLQKWGPE